MQEPDGPPPAFPMTIIKSNQDKVIETIIYDLLKRVDLLEKEIKLLKILNNKANK
jgi:hypothetical protein